jgi:6-phosphogluconate dehydrogenase
MEIGMIGLGRMGSNMTERLVRGGHRVVVYDRNQSKREQAAAKGAEVVASVKGLVAALAKPRSVWLMVPAGDPVEQTIREIADDLSAGDVVIDGGNSHYKDSVRRAAALKIKSVYFVDAGTSGGIWGLSEGYCLMVGGDVQAVERLAPVLRTLAPAADRGWARVGPSGAGHFVKMVHNGIEYGLMQAYAEGFALLEGKQEFSLDLSRVAELWRHGSVVRSWLLDLIGRGLAGNPKLSGVKPYVDDSGEGRWTVTEAIEMAVSAPVISLSLMQRFSSRESDSYAHKLLAVMRQQFGGHAVKR